MIIEIKYDNDLMQRAFALSKTIPSDIKNSIRDGKGTLVGFIGELVVSDYLGVELSNTYDYDLVYKKVKIDVKSKEVTTPPKPEYECSISAYNTKQNCDMYAFTRVDINRQTSWILGWMGKDEYFQKATFRRQGEVDPNSGRRKHTFPCDCYQIKIGDLRSLSAIRS